MHSAPSRDARQPHGEAGPRRQLAGVDVGVDARVDGQQGSKLAANCVLAAAASSTGVAWLASYPSWETDVRSDGPSHHRESLFAAQVHLIGVRGWPVGI